MFAVMTSRYRNGPGPGFQYVCGVPCGTDTPVLPSLDYVVSHLNTQRAFQDVPGLVVAMPALPMTRPASGSATIGELTHT